MRKLHIYIYLNNHRQSIEYYDRDAFDCVTSVFVPHIDSRNKIKADIDKYTYMKFSVSDVVYRLKQHPFCPYDVIWWVFQTSAPRPWRKKLYFRAVQAMFEIKTIQSSFKFPNFM